jgi:transcriptional regulator with XRE-family HTH domain
MASFWGQLIKGLREAQGMSQRRLASYAKINRSTLRKLEDGHAGVAIEIVETILQVLGYELDAITAENKKEAMNRQNSIFTDAHSRSKLAADRILGVR